MYSMANDLAIKAVATSARPIEQLRRLAQRPGPRAGDNPDNGELIAIANELQSILRDLRGAEAEPDSLRKTVELEAALDLAQRQALRYRELFDFAPDGLVLTYPNGLIVEANHAAAALLSTSREFLVDKPFPLLIVEEGRLAVYSWLTGARKEKATTESWETYLKAPKGKLRAVALGVSIVGDPARPEPVLRWVIRDMSLQRQAEQSMLEQRALADSLVDAVEAIVLVVDNTGRILRTNPYLHVMSAYSPDELLGRDWVALLLPAADRPAALRLMQRAREVWSEKSGILGFTTKLGERRAVAWSARALRCGSPGEQFALLGFDVTELQGAQYRALQAERLAAIGQTMTALAHESRNCLQRSQACLSMLAMRLDDHSDAFELLHRAQLAHDDLHRLFETIREYAAPVVLEMRICDLAQVWREAWDELGDELKTVERREQFAGVDLCCQASPFHLRQVFRNVFQNSAGAFSAPATIAIRCEETTIGDREAIRIVVGDSGPGFTAESRKRAFEAFFTTKARGTGLGLAICKRIVEAHGGAIELGKDGPGGQVIITLPRRRE
jgi:PAS domain S-box-containing protein